MIPKITVSRGFKEVFGIGVPGQILMLEAVVRTKVDYMDAVDDSQPVFFVGYRVLHGPLDEVVEIETQYQIEKNEILIMLNSESHDPSVWDNDAPATVTERGMAN